MWAVLMCTMLWALVEPCGAGVAMPGEGIDSLYRRSPHSHSISGGEGQRERLVATSKMHTRLELEIQGSAVSGAATRLRLKTDDKPMDGAVGRHCSPDTCQHCHTAHNCKRHKKYCKWHALDPDHPKEGLCLQRPEHEL